jgi:hypothetical protein
MNRVVGYALLAGCLFVAYQGYQNAQPGLLTEGMAKRAACGSDPTCVVSADRPRKVLTDMARRRYEWRTSQGTRVVTCTRKFIFLGGWNCTSEFGSL